LRWKPLNTRLTFLSCNQTGYKWSLITYNTSMNANSIERGRKNVSMLHLNLTWGGFFQYKIVPTCLVVAIAIVTKSVAFTMHTTQICAWYTKILMNQYQPLIYIKSIWTARMCDWQPAKSLLLCTRIPIHYPTKALFYSYFCWALWVGPRN
jgi:hypothetical protein